MTGVKTVSATGRGHGQLKPASAQSPWTLGPFLFCSLKNHEAKGGDWDALSAIK
jgi:hypothetical protein